MTTELKTLCPICFEFDCNHEKGEAKTTTSIRELADAAGLETTVPAFNPIEASDLSSSVPQGSGRGPTGKLRNFKAMHDTKLVAVIRAIKFENDDVDALAAAQAEAFVRGLVT